jgi:hypothetical protein
MDLGAGGNEGFMMRALAVRFDFGLALRFRVVDMKKGVSLENGDSNFHVYTLYLWWKK